MKHYDIATDHFIEVSPFFKLYWHFCHKKFLLKTWLLKNIVLFFGRGVLQALLEKPRGAALTSDNFNTAVMISRNWFNGTDYEKRHSP